MALTPLDNLRRLRGPGYVVTALLIVVPLVELVLAAWPFQVGQAPWRLSLIGTASSVIGMPVFALFIMLVLAAMSGDRGTAWLISSVCILGAALCLVGSGAFVLDALQMKAQVRAAVASRYNIASSWAVVKLCLAGVTLLVLAVASYRMAKSIRKEPPVRADRATAFVVRPTAMPPERTVGMTGSHSDR
jgi:uncharacterized membrane protein YidH (DUF202 family)